LEENELIERIRDLNDPRGGNIELSLLTDDDIFINLPQNKELKVAFRLSKYHERGWKWHQLVRVVLEKADTKQYMYEKLLSLILKHRKSQEAYFEIRNEEGVFRIPNPLADLNKFELLYNRYFEIYKRIIDGIHFDYPQTHYRGPMIRGKINWARTLTASSTEYPMSFSTTIRQREFETPENILLLLCAEWMHRESSRLLSMHFPEPLTDYKSNLLRGVQQRTEGILQYFPIASVLNESRKYWNLNYSDTRIVRLENETRRRITQKLVNNENYPLLLEWIEKFRELNMSSISESTPTRHIIEPIENMDTIYEIWIFMEFVESLYEKGSLLDFQLGINSHCKFEYRDRIITLWYEREFAAEGPNAWIQRHRPDFTAMLGNEILAVFDAKNYSRSSPISETKDKMLAYMTNLDVNFGALIYPYHPKNWDDLNKDQRYEASVRFASGLYPEKSEYDIRKISNDISKLSWKTLPTEFQSISPPVPLKKYQHPGPGKNARYHHDLTLCLIRMPPFGSQEAIELKEKALNLIFEEIVTRIPITIKT
jgi:hypothetical protein